jgi:CheY-like chemotaxis protein
MGDAVSSGDVKTTVGKISAWIGIISAITTVTFTSLTAYWSDKTRTVETRLNEREVELKELQTEWERRFKGEQIALEGNKERMARYAFVHTLFQGLLNEKDETQKTLTVNLINLALGKEEATALFVGLQSADDKQARELGMLGTQTSLQGARVLWVDDNPENQTYERGLLEQLGVQFTLAKNTDEAVRLLRETPYQLVITDFARSDDPRGAYTLLTELKKISSNTPLIIYSASANEKFIAEAKEKGAFGETNKTQDLFNLSIDAIRSGRSQLRAP